ncbi:Ig-like domain-containing protein, partial [Pseudomonas poae]|uniref:Ig-like domain-containing protein n=1 Tax=Pseudomonas poae TaxID=200451 RepID=UPI00223B8C9F
TPLKDGEHSFSTVVEDPAGNRSPESDPIDFIVDTSGVNVAITHAVDNVGSVIGNLSSGGVTDDTTPTLQGTATANSQVKIHDATGAQIGQVTASADGSWSFEVPVLSEGSHSFTAIATNAAGTQSAQTAPFVLEIDTTAPVLPTEGSIEDVLDDVGDSQGTINNGGVTDDRTPTLVGLGTPGDTVSVYDGGSLL